LFALLAWTMPDVRVADIKENVNLRGESQTFGGTAAFATEYARPR